MRGKLALLAGVCASAIAVPAFAQESDASESQETTEIIVTAQRNSERLQNVPIAISAFSAAALERQQIKNASDLQLTLPNLNFTKTNFTGSSFTIRGVGDLCVGITCDQATAIHVNDAPQFGTRIFEGEFYDMNQIEVLRGPQGTLFGRNATSGVVNLKTAPADLSGTHVSGEAEYGNYNGMKIKGMVNLALTPTLAVRVAGFGYKRDGYTLNLADNSRIDDRKMYGFRGSVLWEPTSSTQVQLMGQFFREQDHRMRIQKQVCQNDPTGVLGCLNGSLPYELTNSNSTLTGVLGSRQFFNLRGLPASLALGDLYGSGVYTGVVNPADPRVVNTGTTPRYFARETMLQGSIKQDLGSGLSLRLQGNYQKVVVDSSQDYNNSAQNRAAIQPTLNTLAFLAGGGAGATLQTYLGPIAAALIPQGPTGNICTSVGEQSGTGVYGGHSVCSPTQLAYDRSNSSQTSWTTEAILSSDWDGKFNFLVGGIYGKLNVNESSYYANSFALDYLSGVLGTLTALGSGLSPSYLGTPNLRNNADYFKLTTFGLFGETYYKFNDQLKLTLGLRYNSDEKAVSARTTILSFLVPFGSTDAYSSPFIGSYDADPTLAGNQLWQFRKGKFHAVTGRAVLDYQITPDNLIYASYSRGYKSGGINPPLSANLLVPETFKPEYVNAFEIGSKNQFGDLQLNLTGFYYKYKDMQLSRIIQRTSVNDNVSANIYGLEVEAIMRPTRRLTVNVNASYMHSSVSADVMLANPRDFGGGRSDAVIIKDITTSANCAVAPNTAGNAAGSNGLVNYVNGTLLTAAGLHPTGAFPSGSGIASSGAYSICSVLESVAASAGTNFDPRGITVYQSGIPVNIRGNKLPGAPEYKASMGVQYEIPAGPISITPRFDAILTGTSTGSIFNGPINRIASYTQLNAQVQIDGPGKAWFVRGYVQNIGNSSPVTGEFVADQGSGNFTNIFTLEPRRYGLTAGFKF